MSIFSRKRNLSMIDLHKYEHECQRYLRKGIPLRPPPTIPGGDNYYDDDLAIMRDNRREAEEIYEYYKNGRHT